MSRARAQFLGEHERVPNVCATEEHAGVGGLQHKRLELHSECEKNILKSSSRNYGPPEVPYIRNVMHEGGLQPQQQNRHTHHNKTFAHHGEQHSRATQHAAVPPTRSTWLENTHFGPFSCPNRLGIPMLGLARASCSFHQNPLGTMPHQSPDRLRDAL